MTPVDACLLLMLLLSLCISGTMYSRGYIHGMKATRKLWLEERREAAKEGKQ